MTARKFFIGKGIGFLILIVLVFTFFGFKSLNNHIYKEKQENPSEIASYRANLSGTQTCLPHKDTSGPQTLECAIGFKTDEGKYYSLDFTLMSQIPPEIQSGDRFSAWGLVTPIEILSSNHLQKYDIVGVFSVTDSVKILDKSQPVSFSWEFNDSKTLNLDGNPSTDIYLKIKYSNDREERRFVETVPGGCNALPEVDSDTLPGTENVQCYYAGFGERFKIIKRENSYILMKQEFQEGSPDNNSPTEEYKKIDEFNM